MNVSPSYYNLLHNEKISIENFINIGNNIRVKIIATCIVLDTYEKKRIADICSASNDLIYLYETVRVKTQIFEPRSTGSRKIEVDYGFLIKEMIWTLRRSDSITNFNNILNYSYNIPFNNEKSILEKAKISWGTKEVMTETGSFYFNQIQPYQYHNSIPKQGIYLYSFSLLPEKSIHSGSYNSANSIKMIIDMNFNKYEPSVLDSMYEKKYNKSYILNNPVNIETVLYITEYKFLQITQNNINLRYSN
jgi:hypothetical protein